jgi:hypothetical protein
MAGNDWTNTFQMLADEFAQIYGERPRASPKPADVGGKAGGTTEATPKTNRAHLRKLYLDFHAPPAYPRTAICLSGGGIRSAAFGLGVLQFLAKADMLHRFEYISTVSGGGYIGSWLSGWLARLRTRGVKHPYPKVHERLSRGALPEDEAPEVEGLRANSNYLTPKLGAFSADTWSAAAIWLRNLIVNWFLLIPLIAAAAVLPQILSAFGGIIKNADPKCALLLQIIGLSFYTVSLISLTGARPRQQAFERGQSGFLLSSLVPLLVAAGLWAISLAHRSEISEFLLKHLPGILIKHVSPQIVVYPLLAFWIYAFALAISALLSRLNPYPYIRIRERKKDGNRLSYSFTLSGPAENGARVDVAPEDQQAVAGKHYYPIDPLRIVFPAGQRESSNTLVINLTGERIGGRPVSYDDLSLKFSNPQRLRLGRVFGWDRVKDVIAFCISGAFFGLFIGLGDLLFRSLLKIPFPGDLLAPDFFADLAGMGSDPAAAADFTFAWHHLLWSALAVPWLLLSHALATVIFVAMTSWLPRSDEEREWLGRAAGWYLAMALAWAAIAALVLLLPLAAKQLLFNSGTDEMEWKKIAATVVSVFGAASGVLTAIVGGGAKTAAIPGVEQSAWRKLALYVGAPVFLMSLFVGLALAIDWLAFGRIFASEIAVASESDFVCIAARLCLFGIVPAIASAIIGYFININRFSLHEMYRNRLVRAFLGASNTRSTQRDRFSFFNFTDNLPMSRLWVRKDEQPPGKSRGPKLPPDPKDWRPFHIINIALNIVSTEKLAWQERKAESFTVSPLWCGSAQLDAYRRTSEYGGKEPISLGTAMAISGAAVSPNMGYNSSPLITFLLTLFNVRLGWWLGNPKRGRFGDEGPRWAAAPLLCELFGLTNDRRKYVYLSDGGHFENLGLYEMVRRRCHLIIVSDAGQDKNLDFGDLSNAVRKIRIDLGIPIEFGELNCLRLRNKDRRKPERGGPCYTIGRIRYSVADQPTKKWNAKVPDGIIIYLKPGFRGDETADIVGYAASSTDFPHETTVDQWFSESQFESYRNLGYTIMKRALNEELNKHNAAGPAQRVDDFSKLSVDAYLKSTLARLGGERKVQPAETERIF